MISDHLAARTKRRLAAHGISLQKRLGQNFLTDPHVLNRIVAAAELEPEDGVVEIGPGMGALTEPLAEAAGKVVAIELDHRLVPVLQEQFASNEQVKIVQGDALKMDITGMMKQEFGHCRRVHLVANLPYYITTPIIARVLEEGCPFTHLVLMMQKEVADRLVARPGSKDYSSISLLVQYYTEPDRVARVPRHVFIPRPHVDSTVVKMKVRAKPRVQVRDESLLFQVIRAAFAKRRKTLRNALRSGLPFLDKEQLESAMAAVEIDGVRRGETLSLEEFAQLTDQIHAGRKPEL